MKKSLLYLLLVTCLLSIHLSSCLPDADTPRLDVPLDLAPLFSYSNRIEVLPYSYLDVETQRFYRIRGDSSVIDILKELENENPDLGSLPFDTVSQMPTLRWERTHKKLVSAGIYKARIETGLDGIMNPEQMVWSWNSTLSSEDDVSYEKGRRVLDGVIQYDLPPVPLEHGQTYYWAVWAWDEKGLQIELSTAEQIFIVEE